MNGLLTDLYQLTMAAGYHLAGKTGDKAVFELFLRRLPPNRNFMVAAGLQQAVDYLLNLGFEEEEVRYLKSLQQFSRMPEGFFDALRRFRFTGDLYAVPEGTPLFPGEPFLIVRFGDHQPLFAKKMIDPVLDDVRIGRRIDAAKAKGEFKGENPARWKGHLDNLLPATSKVRKVRNHPALPYRQLPNFMSKLRERHGAAAAALEFQILTAVRPGNAVAAKWDQIDRQMSVWTIPAALMKSDAEHGVPLSKAALAVLDRMEPTKDDSEYIFPNTKGKPLSDASMAAVIDRMNELERRWIDPKLDREIVPHGFRSSFRDWAAEHGYDDPVAEAALAHKVSDEVVAAYRRTTFLDLRKRMMEDWADYCARPSSSVDTILAFRAQS
jgi:integrase